MFTVEPAQQFSEVPIFRIYSIRFLGFVHKSSLENVGAALAAPVGVVVLFFGPAC
jgi:hypothetical protein